MLPKFLAIGSPRSATSWLYSILKEHPEIYLNPDQKEINFFSTEIFREDVRRFNKSAEVAANGTHEGFTPSASVV